MSQANIKLSSTYYTYIYLSSIACFSCLLSFVQKDLFRVYKNKYICKLTVDMKRQKNLLLIQEFIYLNQLLNKNYCNLLFLYPSYKMRFNNIK